MKKNYYLLGALGLESLALKGISNANKKKGKPQTNRIALFAKLAQKTDKAPDDTNEHISKSVVVKKSKHHSRKRKPMKNRVTLISELLNNS